MAEWTQAYIDNLPDSSFAYIEPGGHKDSEGKTVPRSLRHLPYKDADGKIDKAHLRNALARLSQTKIPPEAKRKAFAKLKAAAEQVGVEVDEEMKRKFADTELRPLKIPVGRIGRWRHPRYGNIEMTQKTFDDMIRNFREKTLGRDPFIRIGHDKDFSSTFGNAPAEGWIQDLQQEGEYLFALADPTNPDVVEAIRTKRYRYASPEYVENYQDKETGTFKGAVLEAVALTNEPFLTRLPEARVLADPPDTFYLDFEEVSFMEKEILEQVKQTNSLLSSFTAKLSEWFGKREGKDKEPGDGTTGKGSEEDKKLAEYEARMKALEEENRQIKRAQREAEIDRKLAEYTAKGIPPAILQQVRPILLADAGSEIIKLADGKSLTQSDQIYAMLDAFPEESRVKLGQVGTQVEPPKPDSPEAVKKLADEDMKALGFTVTSDGKYVLSDLRKEA